jgi:hypothetical protein
MESIGSDRYLGLLMISFFLDNFVDSFQKKGYMKVMIIGI